MKPIFRLRPRGGRPLLLSLVLCLALAQAGVHVTDLTFRTSQFTFGVAGNTTLGNPRGQSTSGQSPGFLSSRYEVVLGEGMDVSDEASGPEWPGLRPGRGCLPASMSGPIRSIP